MSDIQKALITGGNGNLGRLVAARLRGEEFLLYVLT